MVAAGNGAEGKRFSRKVLAELNSIKDRDCCWYKPGLPIALVEEGIGAKEEETCPFAALVRLESVVLSSRSVEIAAFGGACL